MFPPWMEAYSSINTYARLQTQRLSLPAVYKSVRPFRDANENRLHGRTATPAGIPRMGGPISGALQAPQTAQDKDLGLLQNSTSSISELYKISLLCQSHCCLKKLVFALGEVFRSTIRWYQCRTELLKRKKVTRLESVTSIWTEPWSCWLNKCIPNIYFQQSMNQYSRARIKTKIGIHP